MTLKSIQDVRALLAQTGPIFASESPLKIGSLKKTSGTGVAYELRLGWDPYIANMCDETWGVFNVHLLSHIEQLNLPDPELQELLNNVQLDDSHWCWLKKSLAMKGDEYKWFFLMTEGFPQAACLIYHPKPSAIDTQGIYYIEYLAVAPWNRKNPMQEQIFKGLGKLMILHISDYAENHLGLRPGYSLHSLPKAAGFYAAMGMLRFPMHDKGPLPYFETPYPAVSRAKVAL